MTRSRACRLLVVAAALVLISLANAIPAAADTFTPNPWNADSRGRRIRKRGKDLAPRCSAGLGRHHHRDRHDRQHVGGDRTSQGPGVAALHRRSDGDPGCPVRGLTSATFRPTRDERRPHSHADLHLELHGVQTSDRHDERQWREISPRRTTRRSTTRTRTLILDASRTRPRFSSSWCSAMLRRNNSPASTVAPACGNQPPADPGMTSDSEIAGLNANDITLLMINYGSVLGCYQQRSLATGGTAGQRRHDL